MIAKKVLLFAGFLVALLMPALSARAYDAPRVYVKEINIPAASSFKGGSSIDGNFLMWNTTDGIVTDLDYKISLIKDHQVFGEKIFPVSSQIYPDGTYKQNFSYTVPENIASGSYVMFIRLYTKTGMPLNWGQKDIVISGNDNLLRIYDSKLMQGDGEFAPMIGINFDPKENPPVAVFSASNPTAKSIDFDLRVIVYNVQSNMKELESFSAEKGIFDSGEMKNFSVALPRYETPGTYLAKVSFLNKNILVSSEESFRWVVKGQSARILKVSSKKDFFQKDSAATITIDIAGPADGSTLDNVNLIVSILSKNSEVLASSARDINLTSSVSSETFDLVPNADALSPRIDVKIVKDGKELDSYSTEIKSADDTGNSAALIQPSGVKNKIIALVFLLIILLVLFMIIKFAKGKKFLILLLLAIPLAAGLIAFFGSKAHIPFADALGFNNLAVTLQRPMNGDIYNFGGNITFEGDVNVTDCVNMVSSLNVSSYICDQNEANCVPTGDFLSIVPKGIAYVKEGAIGYYYVLDGGGRVVKYNSSSKAYVNEYGSDGSGIGRFKSPNSIFYSAPYIYVADTNNQRIVRFDPSNFAGTWQEYGDGADGSAPGQFSYPVSVFYDKSSDGGVSGAGYVYVAERGSNDRIVRFKPGNVIGTWQVFGSGCGFGVGCFKLPGAVFYDSNSELSGPGSGYVYVAGGWGSQIIRFKPGNVNGTWQKIGADTLTKIEVINGGSGYTAAPTVTITGGGATTNAAAHAVLDGTVVKEIIINNGDGGWGYTSAPTVTITGGGATTNATATADFIGAFAGSGVGKFGNPKGIYYDFASDYIYVSGGDALVKVKAGGNMIDGNLSRVNPVTNWTDIGGYGIGTGNFNLTRGAIYNSTTGNIYVADEGNYRVVKFDPDDINGTWDEIDFTEAITTLDFFPFKIDTTVPVSFGGSFSLGVNGEAYAKVVVKVTDNENVAHTIESSAPIFIRANNAPTIPTVSSSVPASCDNNPSGISLSWVFNDDPGDTQSAYRLIVTRNDLKVYNSGKVNSASSSVNGINGLTDKCGLAANPTGSCAGFLDYGHHYNWTIEVWDNNNLSSGVVSGDPLQNFSTQAYKYPEPGFVPPPSDKIIVNIPVQFKTTGNIGVRPNINSVCYNVSGPAHCKKWTWDFENDSTIDKTIIYNFPTVQNGNTEHTFITPDIDYDVRLSVTDQADHTCTTGAGTKILSSKPSKWKEVIPISD